MTRRATEIEPAYIAARRVLLDALTALQHHGPAVIVAGAQAVYLHTGDAGIAIAPYTTDGDMALDPSLLASSPSLEASMEQAGFELKLHGEAHAEPGIWISEARVAGQTFSVPVDLIVPDGVLRGPGRRGARLGPHGKRAARRAVGLEAALVDHSSMTITALDPGDGRSVEAKVAGPAALLVAKSHKIHDRVVSRRSDRLDDKDAADVVRLMQSTSPREVGRRLQQLAESPLAGPASEAGLGHFRALFGRAGQPGVEMATRALRVGLPATRVETLCVQYTRELLMSAGKL